MTDLALQEDDNDNIIQRESDDDGIVDRDTALSVAPSAKMTASAAPPVEDTAPKDEYDVPASEFFRDKERGIAKETPIQGMVQSVKDWVSPPKDEYDISAADFFRDKERGVHPPEEITPFFTQATTDFVTALGDSLTADRKKGESNTELVLRKMNDFTTGAYYHIMSETVPITKKLAADVYMGAESALEKTTQGLAFGAMAANEAARLVNMQFLSDDQIAKVARDRPDIMPTGAEYVPSFNELSKEFFPTYSERYPLIEHLRKVKLGEEQLQEGETLENLESRANSEWYNKGVVGDVAAGVGTAFTFRFPLTAIMSPMMETGFDVYKRMNTPINASNDVTAAAVYDAQTQIDWAMKWINITGVLGAKAVGRTFATPEARLTPRDLAEGLADGHLIQTEKQLLGLEPLSEAQKKVMQNAQDFLDSVEKTFVPETVTEPVVQKPTTIHEAVREIAPEVFGEYDSLQAKRDNYARYIRELSETRRTDAEANAPHTAEIARLNEQIDTIREAKKGGYGKLQSLLEKREKLQEANELAIDEAVAKDTPDLAAAREAYLKTDARMRDMASQVSEAYRIARENMPELETIETPKAIEEPEPLTPEQTGAASIEETAKIEEIKRTVAEEVEARLIEQGTAPEIAKTQAQVANSFFEAWAAMYPKGTSRSDSMYWYAKEFPEIKKGKKGREKNRRVLQQDLTLKEAREAVQKEASERAAKEITQGEYGGFLYNRRLYSSYKGAEQAFYDAKKSIIANELNLEIRSPKEIELANKAKIERELRNELRRAPFMEEARRIAEENDELSDIDAIKNYADNLADEYDNNIELEAKEQAIEEKKELYEKTRDDIAKALNEEGFGSSLSASHYWDFDGFKIRLSDHSLPPTYARIHGEPDIEIAVQSWFPEAQYQIGSKADIPDIIKEVKARVEKYKKDNPPEELNQVAKGSILLANGTSKAVIKLFKNADESTFMHESAHHFLDMMERYSKESDAPARLTNDMKIIRKWLGVADDAVLIETTPNGKLKYRKEHEKFARGFERYLMEGVAPSKELAGVFAKFKKWLTDIYQKVQKLRAPITDEIRGVFDRMLAINPERIIIEPEAAKLTFKTAKGSEYTVNADGTTTRNKAYRPEHGEKEQGIQPVSQKTFYVTKEQAEALSEFQATGGAKKALMPLGDGRWGLKYLEGKDKGKFEKRTVVTPQSTPFMGGMPVEIWDNGTKVHFGNAITEIVENEPIIKPRMKESAPALPIVKLLPNEPVYAKAMKEPPSLKDFIKKAGGVIDDAGEVSQILDDKKLQKALIKESGMTLDDMALRAWEEGYFPEKTERPTVQEFLERLREDVSGNKQFSAKDAEAVESVKAARTYNTEIDKLAAELSIDTANKTRQQFWDEVAQKQAELESERVSTEIEESRKAELEEFDRLEKEFMESRGEAWEPIETQSRTLEDLENERQQEINAGEPQSGKGDITEHRSAEGTERVGTEAVREVGDRVEPVGREGTAKPERQRLDTNGEFVKRKPVIDETGNINYDMLEKIMDNHEVIGDMRTMVRELAMENESLIQEQKRGKVSWQRTQELADAMGVDPEFLAKRKIGSVFNDVEIRIASAALNVVLAEIKTLADAASKNPTPENLYALGVGQEKLATSIASLMGARSEMGRAFNYLKASQVDLKKATDLQELFQRNLNMSPEDLAKQTKLILEADSPAQLSKMLAKQKEYRAIGVSDWLIEGWKASILSGVGTQGRNFIGNLALNLLNVAEAKAAAFVSDFMPVSKNTLIHYATEIADKKPFESLEARQKFIDELASNPENFKEHEGYYEKVTERVQHGEAGAMMLAIQHSIFDAVKLGWEFFRGRAESPYDMPSEQHTGHIPGKIGEVIRTPFTALNAVDIIFKTMAERQHLYRLGFREAKMKGITDKAEIASYIQKYVNGLGDTRHKIVRQAYETITKAGEKNQTKIRKYIAKQISEKLDEPLAQAYDYAKYVTAQSELGTSGKMAQKFIHDFRVGNVPVLQYTFPFIKTPTNLVKIAGERTPIAALPLGQLNAKVTSALRGEMGTVARDTQVARIAIGTGVTLSTMYMAYQGIITGGGPTDPAERAVWLETHQPYSINIGGYWVSYNMLEPFGTIMGLSADLVQHRNKMTDNETGDIIKLVTSSIADNILNKTWMKSANDVFSAAFNRNSGTNLNNVTGSIVSGFVPNIINSINPDNNLKDARTVLDKVMSKIPGLSESVPNKMGLDGKPIQKAGTWLFGLKTQPVKENPVADTLRQIGVFPTVRMPKMMNNVELTDPQRHYREHVRKAMIYSGISKLSQQKSFNMLPLEAKQRLARKVIDSANEVSRSALMQKYPELIRKSNEARKKMR